MCSWQENASCEAFGWVVVEIGIFRHVHARLVQRFQPHLPCLAAPTTVGETITEALEVAEEEEEEEGGEVMMTGIAIVRQGVPGVPHLAGRGAPQHEMTAMTGTGTARDETTAAGTIETGTAIATETMTKTAKMLGVAIVIGRESAREIDISRKGVARGHPLTLVTPRTNRPLEILDRRRVLKMSRSLRHLPRSASLSRRCSTWNLKKAKRPRKPTKR